MQHAECTESFYKESVTAEIQSRDLDRNDKNKMLAMLQRLEEEQQQEQEFLETDDEEANDELLERFKNIDLDNTDPDLIWDLLSDKERKEFESVLAEIQTTGQWGKLHMPTYEPWWQEQSPLIYEDTEMPSEKPELLDTLPDFTKMSKPESRSSPHLAWNLIHILALYSYLMRQSMGDLTEDLENTVQQCKEISVHVLFSTVPECPYTGVYDVIVDLVERMLESKTPIQHNNNSTHRRFDLQVLLLQDVDLLLKEPARAVYHLYQAFDQLAKKKKPTVLATRKLYFYLAVAGYMDKQRTEVLHTAIQNELVRVEAEKQEFQQGFEAAQDAIEAYQKQQKKIQEL